MDTKRSLTVLLTVSVLLTTPAYAKREAPKLVDAVVGGGIRYEAPNKPSREVVVEAWDEKTGGKLWEQTVYEVKIDQKIEEDIQWDFIKDLRLRSDQLYVTTESGREYRLDVKTRVVEEVERDSPASR